MVYCTILCEHLSCRFFSLQGCYMNFCFISSSKWLQTSESKIILIIFNCWLLMIKTTSLLLSKVLLWTSIRFYTTFSWCRKILWFNWRFKCNWFNSLLSDVKWVPHPLFKRPFGLLIKTLTLLFREKISSAP